MMYRECLKFRVLTLTAFLVSLILFSSCGQSLESHLERGEQFLKQRKFDAAVMQFRAAADIDETSAKAHWGLARAYESQEKFLETVESLRRVVELEPDNLDAQAKFGNYYLLFSPPQFQEAEKIVDLILKKDKKFIEGHILKASILSAQNRSENEIVDVLNHAIKLDTKRTESYLALARFYMKVNKSDVAEATIEKGIAANPKRALGYTEYGRFLTYLDRDEDAEAKFAKAVEVEPKNIESGLALASFYITNRKFDEAEKVYKNLGAVQENSPESKMDLAGFYVLIDREKDAIDVYNGILKDTPDYARAQYELAEIYLGSRDFPKVNAQVEQLIAKNDQDAEALMLRARVRLLENKPDESVADLEEVLKRQPSLRGGLYHMAEVRLALGQIDQARAFIGDLDKYHPTYRRSSLLKIQAAFAANEPENALKEAELLVRRTGQDFVTDAYKLRETQELRLNGMSSRGLANLQLGNIEAAQKDLEEVARLTLNSSTAKINLAKVFVAKGDLSAAQELYSKALDNQKDSFDALSGLVSVLSRKKEFDAAKGRLDQVIKETKSKEVLPALHFLKAEVLSASGDTNAAETELKKSMEIDENYLPSYSAYASLLISRNQTDAALAQYLKVVEKKPSASVYTLIGMLEDGRGKYDKAEDYYRKALELSPGTPIAANNLAWLIADTGNGNLDEAMKLSRDVIKMNPKVSGYFDTLGWVYLKKGFKDQAVEQFKQAVALDSEESQREGRAANPGYRLRLGMALHSAGQKDEGKREVAFALKDGTSQFSSKELQDAKRVLGDG